MSIRTFIMLCGSEGFFFLCKQKTAYEMRISDWSSDVCSSDLMGFGETFAGDGVVLQMGVDRIAPGIGGGDLGDGAIDGPDAAAVRRDLDDRILGDRADCLALPYLGIVGAAIDRLDNDIMAVGDLVGQPARSEEHTSELPSIMRTSYAVFCLK